MRDEDPFGTANAVRALRALAQTAESATVATNLMRQLYASASAIQGGAGRPASSARPGDVVHSAETGEVVGYAEPAPNYGEAYPGAYAEGLGYATVPDRVQDILRRSRWAADFMARHSVPRETPIPIATNATLSYKGEEYRVVDGWLRLSDEDVAQHTFEGSVDVPYGWLVLSDEDVAQHTFEGSVDVPTDQLSEWAARRWPIAQPLPEYVVDMVWPMLDRSLVRLMDSMGFESIVVPPRVSSAGWVMTGTVRVRRNHLMTTEMADDALEWMCHEIDHFTLDRDREEICGSGTLSEPPSAENTLGMPRIEVEFMGYEEHGSSLFEFEVEFAAYVMQDSPTDPHVISLEDYQASRRVGGKASALDHYLDLRRRQGSFWTRGDALRQYPPHVQAEMTTEHGAVLQLAPRSIADPLSYDRYTWCDQERRTRFLTLASTTGLKT